MLSPSTLPAYLHSRGHLEEHDGFEAVDVISPTVGRNRNFLVRNKDGSGLFVKQIRSLDPTLIADQEIEASILDSFHRHYGWSSQRECVPRLVDFDRSCHVLILEYIDGITLLDWSATLPIETRAQRWLAWSATLGKTVAQFHNGGRDPANDEQRRSLRASLPVAIRLQAPEGYAAQAGSAFAAIIRMVQQDTPLFKELQRNQSLWCDTSIIHGDLKWDNVMVKPDSESRVTIVDWELAASGDPAWDIAGVLQSYIADSIQRSLAPASDHAIDRREAADCFFESYSQHSRVPCDTGFVDRVNRFCASRLIQTALEHDFHSSTPGVFSIRLIETSRKMLCQPSARPVLHRSTARSQSHDEVAPDSLRDQLLTIAKRLEIISDSTFVFSGKVHHVDQACDLKFNGSPATPREKLIDALTLVVYFSAYCRDPDEAPYVVPADLVPDPWFVERLSRANQTRGALEPGWSPVRSGLHGWTMQRLDVMRINREDRTCLPYYYFALSETLPNDREDADHVRFYFHCDQHSVFDVMKALTLCLNRSCVPFCIKCMNHSRLFGRRDALVLFVEKRDVDLVMRCVEDLVDRSAVRLSPGIPLFTKAIRPGIGIAEDPGDGQSFGQKVSRLLAEALLLANQTNDLHGPKVLDHIEKHFRRAGIDLDHAHLRPGSAEWFHPGGLFGLSLL
ncbi:T3SS effector HopA1 family protein [Stieleria neptunia]|uniref:T3SS effector HopA1 family protein n=1 Tax=Stieleria neptunia TaxID=2527979 RepID=UPI0018D2238A|nr:T3SS effector HopA1 family protein [Stieleria neptunia]